MARGRGGKGKGPDKSNKLRRRAFSRGAFKRQPNGKKRGGLHNKDDRRKPRTDDGETEWGRRGGLGPGRMPVRPLPVPTAESDAESSEEELSPTDQLLATLNVPKTKAVDSDPDSEEESDVEDESMDDEDDNEGDEDDDEGDEDQDDKGEIVSLEGDDMEEEAEDSDQDGDEVDEAVDAEGYSSSDSEIDADEMPTADGEPSADPYFLHYDPLLDDSVVSHLCDDDQYWRTTTHQWSALGQFTWKRPSSDPSPTPPSTALHRHTTLQQLGVQNQLHAGWQQTNSSRAFGGETLSPLQREIFSVANSYTDLLYYGRSVDNSETIRSVYCLHVLNHVLKARMAVRANSQRLGNSDDIPDECRDQGVTRPRVLIVVPFREAALRVVGLLGSILLPDEKASVVNKKLFQDKFGPDEEDSIADDSKPPDYLSTFAGNIDDNFLVGVSVSRKAVRLFSDLYLSDIIIASPLALKTKISDPTDKKHDHDFLSSIELLIVDQADVLLMQNWAHLVDVLKSLHRKPKKNRGANISRVRPWVVEGWQLEEAEDKTDLGPFSWGRHYRQTLVFTSFVSVLVDSIFTRESSNYAGLVRSMNLEKGGTIQQVVVQMPHTFQRFQSSSRLDDSEARFDYFVTQILPNLQPGTLVYIPSYFDYVHLRNRLNQLEKNFVQICEYHERHHATLARNLFFRNKVPLLLYTERAHFFNRYTIKGIRHLIWYQLPSFPHFYSEMCNLTQLQKTHRHVEITCTVLYSRFDAQRLCAVVGFDRTTEMLAADSSRLTLITGETRLGRDRK